MNPMRCCFTSLMGLGFFPGAHSLCGKKRVVDNIGVRALCGVGLGSFLIRLGLKLVLVVGPILGGWALVRVEGGLGVPHAGKAQK